jgi:hypothetical protein
VTPSVTTTYYVRTRDTVGGCVSETCASVTVEMIPTPAAPTNAYADQPTFCVGGSTQLFATVGEGGDVVEWVTGAGYLCQGGTIVPGGESPVVTPTYSTCYTARSRSLATGCASTTCATVCVDVEQPLPFDFDRDCDIDESDVTRFMECMTGPHISQSDPACQGADTDWDTDVDLSDFGRIQRCLSGDGVLQTSYYCTQYGG